MSRLDQDARAATDVEGLATSGEVLWAVPGVTGLDAAPEKVVPTVGELVAQLGALAGRLAVVDPARLPAGQALGEAEALGRVQHELRLALLARTADVKTRKLYEHLGFRGLRGWQRTITPDAPASDRTLADRLDQAPHLAEALASGALSFTTTTQLAGTLSKLRPVLDRPDALIGGQPAQQTLVGIGEHVLDVICQDRYGLEHDPAVDPEQAAFLTALESQVEQILTCGASQRQTLEQLLLILGTHLSTHKALKAALEDVVYQCLPLEL